MHREKKFKGDARLHFSKEPQKSQLFQNGKWEKEDVITMGFSKF